jgi:hypothetical protein
MDTRRPFSELLGELDGLDKSLQQKKKVCIVILLKI